ncbi:MAG: hypothetical protein HY000_12275, partial [Planctomycetes bacterium]|nr:hypothetical protein [Planctomycetota bacterium]
PIVGNFDPPPPGATVDSNAAGTGTAGTGTAVADTAAPRIVDVRLSVRPKAKATEAIILKASEELAPAPAADRRNYTLVAAGKDRRFGTRDDRPIPVRSVTYDPAEWTVTVTPAKPIAANQLFRIAVSNNLTDLAGSHLENYGVIAAQGTKIAYAENNGSTVTLSLRGRGRIELLTVPGSLGPDLRLVDTIAGRSALAGAVLKAKHGGQAIATLWSITVGNGVANKLKPNIQVQSIIPAASILDELLDSTLTPTGLLAGV